MKLKRNDLSQNLIHWFKGGFEQEAYDTLLKVICSGQLLGGNGSIRGGYTCICFTEAPKEGFFDVKQRYMPFGVMLPKNFIFDLGGRPVIYQSNDEFDHLPEIFKWKHVRYEPTANPPIDFTWKREWRLLTKTLDLPYEDTTIIVPNNEWLERLYQYFESEEYKKSTYDNLMLGGYYSEPENISYKCIELLSLDF